VTIDVLAPFELSVVYLTTDAMPSIRAAIPKGPKSGPPLRAAPEPVEGLGLVRCPVGQKIEQGGPELTNGQFL
jgi:hypothetical protein